MYCQTWNERQGITSRKGFQSWKTALADLPVVISENDGVSPEIEL